MNEKIVHDVRELLVTAGRVLSLTEYLELLRRVRLELSFMIEATQQDLKDS